MSHHFGPSPDEDNYNLVVFSNPIDVFREGGCPEVQNHPHPSPMATRLLSLGLLQDIANGVLRTATA
jgi:hypothetical protein